MELSSNVVKLTHSVLLIDEVKTSASMWHKNQNALARDGAGEVDIFTFSLFMKSI